MADGVDTWEPTDLLVDRGCHLAGFLFARPLPSHAFAALLQAGVTKRRTRRAG